MPSAQYPDNFLFKIIVNLPGDSSNNESKVGNTEVKLFFVSRNYLWVFDVRDFLNSILKV